MEMMQNNLITGGKSSLASHTESKHSEEPVKPKSTDKPSDNSKRISQTETEKYSEAQSSSAVPSK
jgi:hypothetical protein